MSTKMERKRYGTVAVFWGRLMGLLCISVFGTFHNVKIMQIFWFCTGFYLFIFAISRGNQRLLLALHLGIIPGGFGRPNGVLGIKPRFVQGKYPTCHSITLIPMQTFLESSATGAFRSSCGLLDKVQTLSEARGYHGEHAPCSSFAHAVSCS